MTTLIERLRYATTSRPGGICEEAADELERFQTSLVRLKLQLDQQREYHAAELADAERYRWLRNVIYIDPKMLILRIDKVFLRGPLPEALDVSIDEARKATP